MALSAHLTVQSLRVRALACQHTATQCAGLAAVTAA